MRLSSTISTVLWFYSQLPAKWTAIIRTIGLVAIFILGFLAGVSDGILTSVFLGTFAAALMGIGSLGTLYARKRAERAKEKLEIMRGEFITKYHEQQEREIQ